MAISSVLCEGRTEPLLVGSLKSNMGHTEPTAAAAAMLKVGEKFAKNFQENQNGVTL